MAVLPRKSPREDVRSDGLRKAQLWKFFVIKSPEEIGSDGRSETVFTRYSVLPDAG
jgi:hypothetical protein